MANGKKKDDHTDPNKPQRHHQAFGQSTFQGDLQDTEGEAKAQAAENLEYALACFEVDRREGVKKVKDVSFDPLPATSSSEVKASETPPKFGIAHDECAKMIFEIGLNFSRSVYMTILANYDWVLVKRRKRSLKSSFFLIICPLLYQP